ncbi:MAG: GGDEF domain-containing protein, partial [Pseudomonadota bacterium]
MSTGGLFQKEEGIIAAARARLEEGFALPANQKAFADLLRDYERLFKLTKRMIRLSDRNEKQLG